MSKARVTPTRLCKIAPVCSKFPTLALALASPLFFGRGLYSKVCSKVGFYRIAQSSEQLELAESWKEGAA